jgi:ribosomal protein S18 acetylase RimI-like enzyme
MNYRSITVNESKILAEIHTETFENFFLTTLGRRFLNTYYKSCIKCDESIIICAVNENEDIVGFSVGCERSNGFHKRLIKQNLLAFTLQGLIILFTSPKSIIRLLNNLGKKTDNTDYSDKGNYAELLSIAVLPNYKGQGIGKELIRRFEVEAIKKGCSELTLTTDYYNNSNVLEFYKTNGFNVYYEFTTYPNRKMYKLIKNLK